jgi:uncharacterized membrane protein YqjE
MTKIVALLIVTGIFCIYKVIKELRKSITIDLTQEDYEEY